MTKKSAPAILSIVDHEVADPPRPDDFAKISVPLTTMVTAEINEAHRYLRVPADDLIIAALGRAIARTLGSGQVAVDVGTGSFTVPLACTTVRQASATKALCKVHRSLLAKQSDGSAPRSDILYLSLPPEPEESVIQSLPNRGHALELRVYHSEDQLQMDWWYDTRRLDPYTVEELTEQFPLALIELTSEAAPIRQEAPSLAMA